MNQYEFSVVFNDGVIHTHMAFGFCAEVVADSIRAIYRMKDVDGSSIDATIDAIIRIDHGDYI